MAQLFPQCLFPVFTASRLGTVNRSPLCVFLREHFDGLYGSSSIRLLFAGYLISVELSYNIFHVFFAYFVRFTVFSS